MTTRRVPGPLTGLFAEGDIRPGIYAGSPEDAHTPSQLFRKLRPVDGPSRCKGFSPREYGQRRPP